MLTPKLRPQKKILDLALKVFIALCLLLTACLTALHFVPGLAIPLSISKYSPYCSAWQSARDAQIKIDQLNLAGKIFHESRVIRSEAGRKLWSTPDGEYWVPDTSDE